MTRYLQQRAGLSEADQKFLSNIETFGWNVTKVFKNAGDVGPDWAYSTGLYISYQHPEVAIFGLDLDEMQKLVNSVGIEVKKGSQFKPGTEYHEIFANCGCQFRPVQSRYYGNHFGWALWYYETRNFPVFQCFWPDKQGKYPWEDDCVEQVKSAQPLLFQ